MIQIPNGNVLMIQPQYIHYSKRSIEEDEYLTKKYIEKN